MEVDIHVPIPETQLGVVLTLLRCTRGWSQDELSRESGIRNTTIPDYERGRKIPELDSLRRLLAPMGYPLAAVDSTQRFLATLRAGSLPLIPVAPELRAEKSSPRRRASVVWEIEQAAAELARPVARFGRLALVLILERHERSETPSGSGNPCLETGAPLPGGCHDR